MEPDERNHWIADLKRRYSGYHCCLQYYKSYPSCMQHHLMMFNVVDRAVNLWKYNSFLTLVRFVLIELEWIKEFAITFISEKNELSWIDFFHRIPTNYSDWCGIKSNNRFLDPINWISIGDSRLGIVLNMFCLFLYGCHLWKNSRFELSLVCYDHLKSIRLALLMEKKEWMTDWYILQVLKRKHNGRTSFFYWWM